MTSQGTTENYTAVLIGSSTSSRGGVRGVGCNRLGVPLDRPSHGGGLGRPPAAPPRRNFDVTLALHQSWTPVVALALHPVMALLGFDLPMVVAVSAASNVWQLLEHSSVPVPFPKWFAAAVITPAAHRHDHANGDGTNLGPV